MAVPLRGGIVKITNTGRGIHQREIVGVNKLQKALPDRWLAFTNLDLALSKGSREIDVIMIIDDRILLIDIKDWRGKITSEEGAWFQNNKYMDRSPVAKINENARDVSHLLKKHLQEQARSTGNFSSDLVIPRVYGFIVLTGTVDRSGIAPTEVNQVFCIDTFIRMVQRTSDRIHYWGGAHPEIVKDPLTSAEWKAKLGRFFNVSTGPFRPGVRRYGNYRASSDTSCFPHPSGIFAEYDVEEVGASRSTGILRKWDFTRAETHFQSEEGRKEIAGRERHVISWLSDRSPECETSVLQPRVDDPEKGVGYWEIFEKRRRLKRLGEFVNTEAVRLSREGRLELARQILVRAQTLHDLDAAHLDLGAHSVWLESPSTVRLSHLMAASFPEVESLGQARYQFLSCAELPENILGNAGPAKQKDVFLLGCVVYQLLFGKPPKSTDGEPPEWRTELDTSDEYTDLHPWFEAALSWEPKKRFPSAGVMLQAFNSAIAGNRSDKAVLEGLEKFKTFKSQFRLLKEYPMEQELRDDEARAMWISSSGGHPVLVKMWRRASWGDQQREAPRILDFLEGAQDLVQSPIAGCVPIRRAVWLGDAIVLVQDYVDASDLAATLSDSIPWTEPNTTLCFLQTLITRIVGLHERGTAHGDLKPQNILVAGDDREPLLVDLLEFAPASDGDIVSTAYAPPAGDRFERDRFAVTKIAEEMLALCMLDADHTAVIAQAIEKCRKGPPENATLLPLQEAIEKLLAPQPEKVRRKISVSIVGAEVGPLLPDEGRFGLRRAPDRPKLFIRGACEELEIDFDDANHPVRGRRRPIDQRRIAAVSRYEFATVEAEVEVADSDFNLFDDIDELLNESEIAEAWSSIEAVIASPETEGEEEYAGAPEFAPESAADAVADAIEKEAPATTAPDVPFLWCRLVEIEGDLTTEGTAIGDSAYRRDRRRHIVPFALESGVFEFARDDKVLVERLGRGDRWTKIGRLDLEASTADQLVIDARQSFVKSDYAIVLEGQRLRFQSHFEITSRTRRETATRRILSRQSVARDLIDVFDPRTEAVPAQEPLEIDPYSIASQYGLNSVQAHALADLVRIRPACLLQGPPGTGKTRFIGALVHFVLTHGLARNVLLASQSHEAVNNAAEAVLELFRGQDTAPSILRIGHEGAVSDRLLPHHVARVEGLYKDRFKATLRERLQIAGRALGLSDELVDDLLSIDSKIRPIVDRIAHVAETDAEAGFARIAGLRHTLAGQIDVLGVEVELPPGGDDAELIPRLVKAVTEKHGSESPDRVERLRAIIRLSEDIIGSVSSRQRTLETFLAGTRQIVAGTCVGLGRSSLGLITTPFDLVVVDEAARCTASELAVPIQAGRWVVLVGDQAQLPPFHSEGVLERVARETRIPLQEIVKSDFERLFESSYGKIAGRQLTTQYRMLAPIGRVASKAFYKGALIHGRDRPILDHSSLPNDLTHPLAWLVTDGFGEAGFQKHDLRRGQSLQNPIEAELIISLLKKWDAHEAFRTWLAAQDSYVHTIGVICTYAAQSQLIRQKLRVATLSAELARAVNVDTVDGYQGKENPIVLLSLVRNNADGHIENGAATIRPGFMSRPNRINVAVSRAMDRLVIVGARARWPNQGPVARIANAFAQEVKSGHARVIPAVELWAQFDVQTLKPRASKSAPTGVQE